MNIFEFVTTPLSVRSFGQFSLVRTIFECATTSLIMMIPLLSGRAIKNLNKNLQPFVAFNQIISNLPDVPRELFQGREDLILLFDLVRGIETGIIDAKYVTKEMPKISNTRWVTTFVRILRLYIQTQRPTLKLQTLVDFIVKVRVLRLLIVVWIFLPKVAFFTFLSFFLLVFLTISIFLVSIFNKSFRFFSTNIFFGQACSKHAEMDFFLLNSHCQEAQRCICIAANIIVSFLLQVLTFEKRTKISKLDINLGICSYTF